MRCPTPRQRRSPSSSPRGPIESAAFASLATPSFIWPPVRISRAARTSRTTPIGTSRPPHTPSAIRSSARIQGIPPPLYAGAHHGGQMQRSVAITGEKGLDQRPGLHRPGGGGLRGAMGIRVCRCRNVVLRATLSRSPQTGAIRSIRARTSASMASRSLAGMTASTSTTART